jgi:predicted nucleic-acid-binding protein
MKKVSKYIVDTNVIARYLLRDNEELFQNAKIFFDKVKLGIIKAYIEQTVFTETIYVLSSIYKVPREEIAKVLSDMLMYKGVLNEDLELLSGALEIYRDSNLHIVDCLICYKTKKNNLQIMSYDEELKQFYNE